MAENVLCSAPVMAAILRRSIWVDTLFRRRLREVSKGFRDAYDRMTSEELELYSVITSLETSLHENISTVILQDIREVSLGTKNVVYPRVIRLEITPFWWAHACPARILRWFPNLEVAHLNCVFTGEFPPEMPFLERLFMRDCPWQNLLEACPSLRRFKVSSQENPLSIKGESMDYLGLASTSSPFEVQLEKCHKLYLWASDTSTVKINHVGFFYLEARRNPYYTIGRVDTLHVLHLPRIGLTDDSGKFNASIDSIGTLILRNTEVIHFSEFPVENLVIECGHCVHVSVKKSPLLKRVVLCHGYTYIRSIDVEVKGNPVTLLINLRSIDLRKSTKKLRGIKKLVFTEVTGPSKGPQFPEDIETFYRPRKTRGSSFPVVTDDEDYNWFKLVYISPH